MTLNRVCFSIRLWNPWGRKTWYIRVYILTQWLQCQPSKPWWNHIHSLPGWAWETWILQTNADFNNIWTDNKDVYGVNFSFCQMFSIKILIILTLDCKTWIKRVEQLWQPSVKFPDVWKQHYNDFISFNMDILELGRDKLKEPFFLRQWFSLGFLLFKSYAERQKELPYKNALQN